MASVRKRSWWRGGAEKTAWVVDYADQSKRRHLRTFGTKKEAEAYRTEACHEIALGVHTHPSGSITVAEAGRCWIEQGEADGLERSTLKGYREHLDRHIAPHLGRLRLADLTPAAVEAFRNRLIKDGRSHAMARKVLVSLGSLLSVAQAQGRVARNVVRERSRKRDGNAGRHKRRLEVGVDVPTKAEIRAMLEHAKGRWRPLLVTAIFTGLRASELRGLTWADVDLKERVVRVRQRADRWNAIGSPKSAAGARDVPLAPMVANTLREWQLSCPKSQFVFPNGKGRVERLNNIHARGLGAVQKAAGISSDPARPKYGLHSLRHAAASLFIEQGFTPKRVQAIMGHSSIGITFDRYGHLFPSPEDDRRAMEQIEARLVG